MLRYILPSVEGVLPLERRCPHCGRNQGRIHSALRYRAISDIKARTIPQRRMMCPWCRTTWTLRAEGVKPGFQRSRRLVGLGVVLYMLGLSDRGVETFLPLLGCRGGKSSIDRDVKGAGQRARDLHGQAPRMHFRVLGVDGTGAAMAGKDRGLLFFVGIGPGGGLIAVEPIHEEQTQKVRDHVAKVMAEVGAEELRTDEHSVYEGIMPEGRHRLCLTHWLKSKCKRAADLLRAGEMQEAPFEADTMRELLELLRKKPRAPTVPEELSRLVRRYIYARKGLPWKVNQLLQHVERTWEKVSDDPADPTNNQTERLIGLTFKIRSKTMRGFKSMEKVLTHPHLSFFLRGRDGLCDLRKVI
jgi:hypothetical protein